MRAGRSGRRCSQTRPPRAPSKWAARACTASPRSSVCSSCPGASRAPRRSPSQTGMRSPPPTPSSACRCLRRRPHLQPRRPQTAPPASRRASRNCVRCRCARCGRRWIGWASPSRQAWRRRRSYRKSLPACRQAPRSERCLTFSLWRPVSSGQAVRCSTATRAAALPRYRDSKIVRSRGAGRRQVRGHEARVETRRVSAVWQIARASLASSQWGARRDIAARRSEGPGMGPCPCCVYSRCRSS
mmetsp:Transcript_7064/g.23217  ORF Transcript_7064/g.23217 Transcript_7064/m.23217 type:complete len:243 (+) Transcript_7064:1317-2045(+)